MKSHTMTFNLDKTFQGYSLGEVLTKAACIVRPYCGSECRDAHWIAEVAVRAVCEAIIRSGCDISGVSYELPELLHVDFTGNDSGDDPGDWWKQSRYSLN